MTKSLINAIKTRQLALQTIPLLVKSETGSQLSFAIVEDESDQEIYEKFFSLQFVRVFTSAVTVSTTGGGNKKVIEITLELNSLMSHIPVFGIIDADYTRFSPSYTQSPNIFRTDARDIEMMMFQCPFVHNELKLVLTTFSEFYHLSVDIAREIGFYRMFNDILHLGFNFKKFLSLSKLVDPQTRSISTENLLTFKHAFFSSVTDSNIEEFESFRRCHEVIETFEICRGHDVISLLGFFLKNSLSQKELRLHLAVYYDYSSFSRTQLHNELVDWGLRRGRNLFA